MKDRYVYYLLGVLGFLLITATILYPDEMTHVGSGAAAGAVVALTGLAIIILFDRMK